MTHKKSLVELEQTGKYGCVVIHNCGCDLSSQISGHYFSFAHVPSLPLTGCSSAKCSCEYLGVIDKRVESRRVSGCDSQFSVEHRKSDRRKNDN